MKSVSGNVAQLVRKETLIFFPPSRNRIAAGYLEPLLSLKFPEERPPAGFRSLGFGPTYVHVSDLSLAT